MLEDGVKRSTMFTETSSMPSKIGNMIHPDPNLSSPCSSAPLDDIDDFARNSSFSAYDSTRLSGDGSPMVMSPWNQNAESPWSNYPSDSSTHQTLPPQSRLIGSLVREEGHIYSLAAKNGLLYTGSDSKNIRVWKNMKDFSGFKSNSGLVKAIVISGDDKIFTGHQDGKIRVWRVRKNPKNPGGAHRRVGTMPTFFDILRASIRPGNYVEVKRKRSTVWIKHTDAISCLSLDEEKGLLYSASWDRTFKVWRAAGNMCVESVRAHDDAVNSVVASGGLVYTGSADGSVKVWRREEKGKAVRHVLARTLLSQESAVTALAVGGSGSVVYCGSSDGLVNFWEVEKELSHGGVLKGHRLAVLCLEAAGNLVLSGSADKTICVWRRDGSVHTCLSVLTGHTGPVKCLTVEGDRNSSDGDRKWIVYSGSLDKSVKVWSVSETAPDLQQRDGSFNWGFNTIGY